ncbi:uncharacterized protein LOC126298183 [Schistocerca gregaria]|uniref:uncharacterized protein LOC126298183 n=1 Tax=Schistocerca gregaria TaxID=7010 RepID=UPI00211DB207|nr:uncharacterized protein LOC126298183 [Schistocerca gregaria]
MKRSPASTTIGSASAGKRQRLLEQDEELPAKYRFKSLFVVMDELSAHLSMTKSDSATKYAGIVAAGFDSAAVSNETKKTGRVRGGHSFQKQRKDKYDWILYDEKCGWIFTTVRRTSDDGRWELACTGCDALPPGQELPVPLEIDCVEGRVRQRVKVRCPLGSGSSRAAVAATDVVGAASLKRAGVPQPAVRSAPQPPPPSPKLAAHRTMAAKVLLLGSVVALAAASLRPTNPDQLHELLLWAQRVQSAGAHSGAGLHDKPSHLGKPSHTQQSERPAVAMSPPPPPPQPQPQVWSPPPVADSVLELLRPGLPAYEEYDRNQRFSHSFLHGYRHT